MFTDAVLKAMLGVAGVALVLSLLGHGWQYMRLADARSAAETARTELASARADHERQRAAWAEASRQAEAAYRETEHLRRMARDRIIDEANTTIARQDVAAAELRSTAQRLRDHIPLLAAAAASAGQAAGDPATAGGSSPAAGAGLVLADLYASTDREAEELAVAFDSARARGLACERTYDSLTSP